MGLWIILGIIGAGLIVLIVRHDAGSVLGIANEDFASALFLGVWASVIAAAVISRPGQWREAARNAVLWLGIILVLVTVYVYRYDLQDVAARVTAGIVPGSPISGRTDGGRRQVTVLRSADGHFHVRGAADGARIAFLVDTGASSVVLTGPDARAAGIDTARLRYSVPVSTANGRTSAAPVTLASLDIGQIRRERIRALVARDGQLETSLLGMGYLSTLWRFEVRGDRLVLTD